MAYPLAAVAAGAALWTLSRPVPTSAAWKQHVFIVGQIQRIDFTDGQTIEVSGAAGGGTWRPNTNEIAQWSKTTPGQWSMKAICLRLGLRASAGPDRRCVDVYNDRTSTHIARLKLDAPATCLAFSPDGRILAAGTEDRGGVAVWLGPSWKERDRLPPYGSDWLFTASSWALAFSPNGKLLAIGSLYGSVELWNTEAWTRYRVLKGAAGNIGAVAFSPDGEMVAAAAGGTAVIWQVGKN